VEAHRGAILVDGNEGTGACFTVYLPGHVGRGVEHGINA
jgi:signal transduction histidine kinase